MSKAELSKRVMRSIAIGREQSLFRDRSGNAPIIIALPNERAGDVLNRAQRHVSDGGVNVVVAYAKSYDLLSFDGSLHADVDLEISGDLSMGMLCIKSNHNPGKSIRVTFGNGAVDVPVAASFAYA